VRSSLCLIFLLLASACDPGSDTQDRAASSTVEEPTNLVAQESTPASEGRPPEIVLPETPPEDPALGALSPSRRREYERGYRDCRTGNYDYDAETQGEYYRIGCMAAENLKAGAKP
jgi:hypothetical protein